MKKKKRRRKRKMKKQNHRSLQNFLEIIICKRRNAEMQIVNGNMQNNVKFALDIVTLHDTLLHSEYDMNNYIPGTSFSLKQLHLERLYQITRRVIYSIKNV